MSTARCPGRLITPTTDASRSRPTRSMSFKSRSVLTASGFGPAIRISGHDGDPPTHHLHGIGSGHVALQSSSRVTIYHDSDHPSHLLLPVTRGNRIGTFISGGMITT